MKRLIKLLLLFLFPITFFFVVLEIIVVQIPNNYSYKYSYVKKHGDGISTIAIGHSQLFNGFSPSNYGDSTFNMSSAGQRYIDDYYILRETLDDLPNLKTVILPLSYLDVVSVCADTTLQDLSVYYHEYMNIDYDGRLPLEFYFECFRVRRAVSKAFQYYLLDNPILTCGEFGEAYKMREKKFALTVEELYSFTVKGSSSLMVKDCFYLEKILKLLEDNEILAVLVSPPFYWKGFNDENTIQTSFLHQYAEELKVNYGVLFVDMQKDCSFDESDFADTAHLSEKGAVKFSRKLSHLLK